jgi:hypothetical protein
MDNVQGLVESALVVFSGLVCEANPPDVPAGSSPVCCDCDFTVASVKTRDGLESIYTFQGYCVTEITGCAASFSTNPSEVPWSNPTNILLNTPGTYASVILG